MERTTIIGLLAVLGIWLTAGFSLPFVNVLDTFSPGQLMVSRGTLTALFALVGMRGIIRRIDPLTFALACILPMATLGLYEGIRAWGAGPTIIVVTATPLVNVLIGTVSKKKISFLSLVGFALVITGVAVAHWGGTFSWNGFGWAAFATLMNGLAYELIVRAKATSLEKCFWACIGIVVVGGMTSFDDPWRQTFHLEAVVPLLAFSFVGGFLYWMANLAAFKNLPTVEASILAQGETPAVILGAGFLLGEQLSVVQWFGVSMTLLGAGYLSMRLARKRD